MPILKLIVRRLLLGFVTLIVVSVAVFVLTNVLGDPVKRFLGRGALPEVVKARRAELGLNRPIATRYFEWLKGLLTGDPGRSYTNDQRIIGFLGDRLKNSLFLMALSAVISIPLSLFLGAYSALRRDSFFDRMMSNQLLVLAAMPEFVVGTFLTALFATNVWHLVPSVSKIRPGQQPWSDLQGVILPVLTLVLAVTPHVGRTMRASMIEVLESDYVEMARLKGLSERTVLWGHAFPNAIGPTLQVIALNIAYLAGGVVIVESLFNFRGVGIPLRDAIRSANAPVVQFIAMFIATIYVICNLVADLGTILVTPRLRTRLQ